MATVIRTSDAAGFIELLTLVIDMLRRGKIAGVNAHFEPTGIGRVGVTTVDGIDVELPGVVEDGDP